MLRINLIKAKDPAEVGRLAADIFQELINAKPDCVLGLATGSTPLPLYRELIQREKDGKLSFAQVRSANLDEYKGLSGDHPQSYRYFMNENLFNHISIDPANTIVPDGLAEDAEAMCAEYERKIEAAGGIDLQFMGIGRNGHIGFNEPAEAYPDCTSIITLTESTIDANKRFFDSIDEVPTAAYTMGIGTVMAARKVLLLATGKDKAEIVYKSFFGPVDPMVPASILQFHGDVTVIVDEAAGSLIK